MAITSIKTGSSFTNLIKYENFLGPNAAYIPAFPSFESIATGTGTGSSNTITLSSIPSTYKHLQIRFSAITGASSQIFLRLNGDSGSTNYTKHYTLGRPGGGLLTGGESGTAEMLMMGAYGTVATYPNVGIIDIHDYASTNKYKVAKSFAGANNNSSADGENDIFSGLWKSTSAINSISIISSGSNFGTSTIVSLYGIKGA